MGPLSILKSVLPGTPDQRPIRVENDCMEAEAISRAQDRTPKRLSCGQYAMK